MVTASSIEFFAIVRSGKEDLLTMRTAGYYDDKGSDIQNTAVFQVDDKKFEYRLKPMIEGKPYGQWIGIGKRGRNSILQWYANTTKLKSGDRIGLDSKPEGIFQPAEGCLDSNFKVGMKVLVKVKWRWISSTVLNVGPEGITVSYYIG